MANQTAADKAATSAADKAAAASAVAPEAEDEDGLVPMRKDREVLRVHPTAVKDHQRAGWSHA